MSIPWGIHEGEEGGGDSESVGDRSTVISSEEDVEFDIPRTAYTAVRPGAYVRVDHETLQRKVHADGRCSIPNIPFFYLCFRAYSHYRALYGGKLLEHITSNSQVVIRDSPEMDEMYTAGLLHPTREASRAASRPTEAETEQVARVVEAQTRGDKEDVMVLQKWNGKLIAERFKLPEMEIEIERAVEQVEAAIEKDKAELNEEKDEVMRATGDQTREGKR